METALKQTKSCNCKFTQKVESFWVDKTEDAATNEPQMLGEPVAEICETCKRPIDKTQVFVELVDVGGKA